MLTINKAREREEIKTNTIIREMGITRWEERAVLMEKVVAE